LNESKDKIKSLEENEARQILKIKQLESSKENNKDSIKKKQLKNVLKIKIKEIDSLKQTEIKLKEELSSRDSVEKVNRENLEESLFKEKENKKELENKNADLLNRVNTLESENRELKTKISHLDENNSSVGDLKVSKGYISHLETVKDSNEETIRKLQGEKTVLENQYKKESKDMENLYKAMEIRKDRIIAENEAKLETLEKDLKSRQNSINQLSENNITLQSSLHLEVQKVSEREKEMEELKSKLQISSDKVDFLSVEKSDDERRLSCKICMEKEADTVLLPCCHLFCCTDCNDKLGSDKGCPVCKMKVENIFKIFIS